MKFKYTNNQVSETNQSFVTNNITALITSTAFYKNSKVKKIHKYTEPHQHQLFIKN